MSFLATVIASFLQCVKFLIQEVFLGISQFDSIVTASPDIFDTVDHHHFLGLVILIKVRDTLIDIDDLHQPVPPCKS